jgi:hypothetical protein
MNSGNTPDLPASGTVLRSLGDAAVAMLLACRGALAAEAGLSEDRIAFVIPATALPGVAWLYGSRVVRADITGPMVALSMPTLPG